MPGDGLASIVMVSSLVARINNAAGGSANVAAAFLYGVNATVSGGTLSSWADANGKAVSIAQATGAKQPTDTGSAYLFDGVSQYLQGTYTLPQPFTRFIVVNPVSWTSLDYIYDGGTTDSTVVQQFTSTPNVILVAGAAGPQRNLPVGTFAVLTAVCNGASSVLQVGDGTAANGNAGANAAGGLTLGARATGLSNGNISVKAVVDVTVVDTTTRQAIKNVLYAAYGVSP